MDSFILPSKDYDRWNAFVNTSPQGSIFSTTQFLDALGKEYHIGVLEKNGAIQAGIVLSRNEIRSFSNPMFAKYLGVLLSPENKTTKYVKRISKEKQLIAAIVQELHQYRSFDYSFHPAFKNWLPFYWKGYRQETKYTYRFNDISDIDHLLSLARTGVRGDLKKAEKNNITIHFDIEPEAFYVVNSKTFERQGGTPPFTLKLLKSLYTSLAPENKMHLIGAVNDSDMLVAVAGVVNDQNYSYFLLNGIDHTFPNVGANTKLIIETIRYCANLAPGFDFEGSMIKEIGSFYQGFGAELTPYFTICRDNCIVRWKHSLIKAYKLFKYGR